ncbi:MAG: RDD family protein [Bacilli bacterium]|nr:RDD family protein [Bacilli bacterium]MDY5832774.1 RDD family protein [Candidatus Onthovivens sp.]
MVIFSFTSIIDFNTIESLTNFEYEEGETKTNINMLKCLYTFYSEKYVDYDGTYNLSLDTFKTNILKINSEVSNIKDFIVTENNVNITLIDETLDKTTILFICDTFSKAADIVNKCSAVQAIENKNKQILLNSILYVFPCLFFYCFILEFLIPVCSKHGETIGKYIFKLMVISKDGYELKKIYYLPRFLSYLIIEVILSFVTIGGTFLISYTMFQFTKKRRCIHDYLSKSCVVDKELSFVFKNKKIEEAYKNKYGEEYEQEFKAN